MSAFENAPARPLQPRGPGFKQLRQRPAHRLDCDKIRAHCCHTRALDVRERSAHADLMLRARGARGAVKLPRVLRDLRNQGTMLEFNVMDDSDGDNDLDHLLSNPSLAEFVQETVQQVQVTLQEPSESQGCPEDCNRLKAIPHPTLGSS